MRSPSLVPRFIPLLFVPAGLALLFQVATSDTVAEQLLALALALFCPELAYLARIDLENAAAVAALAASTQEEDSRLRHFHRVVISTIVLEATGFYTTFFSLQWGAILIISSQIWFNLLAGIRILPSETSPAKALQVVSFGIAERQAVLAANTLGLGLLCFWFIESAQIWLASGLLGLTILFLTIKYGHQIWDRVNTAQPS